MKRRELLAAGAPVPLASFCFAGQADQAIEQLRKTVEIDANFPRAHWDLGIAYEQEALYPEAIAQFQTGLSLSEDPGVWLGSLGHAQALSGRQAEARKTLAELVKRSKRQYIAPFEIALIHAGLGEREQTFQWLEKAFEDRSTWLTWLKFDPRFAALRDALRFADLLRRVGLPP